jgi:transposase, IS6 family
MIERGVQVDHSNEMGTSIFPWNRKEDQKTFKANKRFVESWWNLYKSKRWMEIFLQSSWLKGDTTDFMLSAKRNRKAAKRFFKKALSSNHNQIPRVITIDKNPAYPPAINELKNDKILPKNVCIRQIKYLNNIIEQDHRSKKRIVNPMLGFQSFQTANRTLKGIEAINMIKKGQVNNLNYSVLMKSNTLIYYLV